MTPPNAPSRYPGPKPFTTDEMSIFKGRENESRKLFDLLQLKQTMILYAESGTGKSSLINAGLIPMYSDNQLTSDYAPCLVRFGYCNPVEHIEDSTPNILVQRILRSLRATVNEIADLELNLMTIPTDDTLWCEMKKLQLAGHRILLIIDQSEEIFSYSPEQIQLLKKELYDLYAGIPKVIEEAYESHVQALEKNKADEEGLRRAEEDLHFLYSDLRTKVLLVVRDDKLGNYHQFADYFPDILKDSYKLLALQEQFARDAITLPAEVPGIFASDPFTFEKDALSYLIQQMLEKNQRFDPFTIQLTCRFIEKNLVIGKHKKVIEKKDVPNVAAVVQQFIDSVFERLPATFYTDKIWTKHRIEKKLISRSASRRISVHEDKKWISPRKADYLIAEGLLKREQRGEDFYLELSHDRLVMPLQMDFRKRKENILLGLFASVFIIAAFVIAIQGVSIYQQDNRIMKQNAKNDTISSRNITLQDSIDATNQAKQDNLSSIDAIDNMATKKDILEIIKSLKTQVILSETPSFTRVDSSLNYIIQEKYNKQLYKIDVFYVGRANEHQKIQSLYSSELADSVLRILGQEKNLVVRKRMLRPLSDNSPYRASFNQIRFNGQDELLQAEEIRDRLRAAIGINMPFDFQRTSTITPHYISIVLKNK